LPFTASPMPTTVETPHELPSLTALGILGFHLIPGGVFSALLFGRYHFFTLRSLPAIFVAFLPVCFVVQARRDFRIVVVVHAMFNLAGVVTVFPRAG
jgi:hypothetical protein